MYRDDDEAAALKLSATESECDELAESAAKLAAEASRLEGRLARARAELQERGFAEKGIAAFVVPVSCALLGLLVGVVVTPDLLVWNLGLGFALASTVLLLVLSIQQRRRHARELGQLESRVRELESPPPASRVRVDDAHPEEAEVEVGASPEARRRVR